MPETKKTKEDNSNGEQNGSLEKQIEEVRNSAIALYNVLESKGILTEKEFMDEYKNVSAKKKK